MRAVRIMRHIKPPTTDPTIIPINLTSSSSSSAAAAAITVASAEF